MVRPNFLRIIKALKALAYAIAWKTFYCGESMTKVNTQIGNISKVSMIMQAVNSRQTLCYHFLKLFLILSEMQ